VSIPESKSVLATVRLESEEEYACLVSHPAGVIPKTLFHDDTEEEQDGDEEESGVPGEDSALVRVEQATPGRTQWESTDYLLHLRVTVAGDPKALPATPVVGLLPDEENSTTLPWKGTLYEGVLGWHLTHNPGTGVWSAWYWVYGWTTSAHTNSTKNLLAALTYDDKTAVAWSPTDWWVVPQKETWFPRYTKAQLLLMFTTGQVHHLDLGTPHLPGTNTEDSLPYLVTNHPVVVQSWPAGGDACCVGLVTPTSLTKDSDGYYPGTVKTFDPATRTYTDQPCLIQDANA
jgi:hypothetical protein